MKINDSTQRSVNGYDCLLGLEIGTQNVNKSINVLRSKYTSTMYPILFFFSLKCVAWVIKQMQIW